MTKRLYYEILQKAKLCDSEISEDHLQRFVSSFVIKEKRMRWSGLFLKKPKKLFETSHKLESALDCNHCQSVSCFPGFGTKIVGVFFDFSDPPVWLPATEVAKMEINRDALFSIEPGKTAFLLSHEGRLWDCQKK